VSLRPAWFSIGGELLLPQHLSTTNDTRGLEQHCSESHIFTENHSKEKQQKTIENKSI